MTDVVIKLPLDTAWKLVHVLRRAGNRFYKTLDHHVSEEASELKAEVERQMKAQR